MDDKKRALASLARARAAGSRFVDDEASCSESDSEASVSDASDAEIYIDVDGDDEQDAAAAAGSAAAAAGSASVADSFVNSIMEDAGPGGPDFLFAPMEGSTAGRLDFTGMRGHSPLDEVQVKVPAKQLSTIPRRDYRRHFIESKREGDELKGTWTTEIQDKNGLICGEFQPPEGFPIVACYNDAGSILVPDDAKTGRGSFAASDWNNMSRGTDYFYQCYLWFLLHYFAKHAKPQVYRASYVEGLLVYPNVYCRLAMQFENGAGIRMYGGFESWSRAIRQFCAIAENVLASSIGLTTGGDKAFFCSTGKNTSSCFKIFKQGKILTVVFDNIIVPAKILPFFARNFDVLLRRLRDSDAPANHSDFMDAFFGQLTHNTLRPAWDLPGSSNCLWVHEPGVLLASVVNSVVQTNAGLIKFVVECSRADFAEKLLAFNPERELEEWHSEDWEAAALALGFDSTPLRTIWYAMRSRYNRISNAIEALFNATRADRELDRQAAVNWALRFELLNDTSVLIVMTESIFNDEGKLPKGMVVQNFNRDSTVGIKLAVPDGFNPDDTYLDIMQEHFLGLGSCLLDIRYHVRPVFNAAKFMNTIRVVSDIFGFSTPEKMQLCIVVCSIFFVMGPGGKAISTEHLDNFAPWLKDEFWCAIVQRPFSQTSLPLNKMSFTFTTLVKNKKGEDEEKEKSCKVVDILTGAYANIGVAPDIFSVRDNDDKSFRQCIGEKVVNTAVPPNPIHGDIPEFYSDFSQSLRLEMNDLLTKLVTIVGGNRDGSALRKNWTKGAAVWQVANLCLFVLKAQNVPGRNEKVAWLWSQTPGVMKSTVVGSIAAIYRTTTISYSSSSDDSAFDSNFPARLRIDDDRKVKHKVKERAQSGPGMVAKNKKYQETTAEVDRESLIVLTNSAEWIEWTSGEVFHAIARRLWTSEWNTLLTNRDWINSFRRACEANNYRAFRALLIYFRSEPGFFDRMIPTTIETLWAIGHKINKKGAAYPGVPYMATLFLVHLQGFSFPKFGNRMFYYLKLWLSQGRDNTGMPHPNMIPLCILKRLFLRWNLPFLKDPEKNFPGKVTAWKEFKRILMLFSTTTYHDWGSLGAAAQQHDVDNLGFNAATDDAFSYEIPFDTDEHKNIFNKVKASLLDAWEKTKTKHDGNTSVATLADIDWWGLAKWLDIDSLAHHRDQSGWVRMPEGIETPLFDQESGKPMVEEWPVAEDFTWADFQKEFASVETAEQATRGKTVFWDGLDVTEELSAYRREGESIAAQKQAFELLDGGVRLGEE